MVNGQQCADWLRRLVQIPSVNPAYVGPRAGIPGEARIMAHVAEWFAELGGEVLSEDVYPDRPSIYGLWRGHSAQWMAVDVHLDTVGVEQMIGDPFGGEIRDGRVYGRGAVDTKATLGVELALLEHMRRTGQKPAANLLVAATSDEETGPSGGAHAFAKWVRKQGLDLAQLAVAEATHCGPVCGHKGQVRLEFVIEGVSAHSSQPHRGKNAISAAARLIAAFDAEHQRQQEIPRSNRLGAPVLSVTTISGGRGTNVIPDQCIVNVDRRVVDGEDLEEVRDQLIALAGQSCSLPFTVAVRSFKAAFAQSADSPWIRQLAAWSGKEPTVVPYGTNAHAYGGLARETVIIGPGSIDQAHGNEEWVEIAELEKMAGILGQWWGLE
jgi:succinyl-diaminopimelate desuccinylase